MASKAACSCVVLRAVSKLFVYPIMLCWSDGDMVPVVERTVDGTPEKEGSLTMLWALAYPSVRVRHSHPCSDAHRVQFIRE